MSDLHVDGLSIRLARLVNQASGNSLIVALDATLFSGPTGHLANPTRLAKSIADENPEAILGFPGLMCRSIPAGSPVGRIINGTASTTLDDPADKVVTATLDSVVRQAADAVALHLNLGHPKSDAMLRRLASAISEFNAASLPVLVASYVPDADPIDGWSKIAHAARIASDLGATIVKTAYTGTPESYARVVEAAHPARVVAAGGSPTSLADSLAAAQGAIAAGALGIAYGRTIFEAERPAAVVRALKAVIHEGRTPAEAVHDHGLGEPQIDSSRT